MLVIKASSYFPISDIIGKDLFCRPNGSPCFCLDGLNIFENCYFLSKMPKKSVRIKSEPSKYMSNLELMYELASYELAEHPCIYFLYIDSGRFGN